MQNSLLSKHVISETLCGIVHILFTAVVSCLSESATLHIWGLKVMQLPCYIDVVTFPDMWGEIILDFERSILKMNLKFTEVLYLKLIVLKMLIWG